MANEGRRRRRGRPSGVIGTDTRRQLLDTARATFS